MCTEVHSPLNHTCLCKNTTEETDEFVIKNTQNDVFENTFKRVTRSSTNCINETCNSSLNQNMLLEQNGSSSTLVNDNVPSVKDIKEDSSHSTIDKIHPQDLMEDSMNTCSLNKESEKRITSKPKVIEEKPNGFMTTLSNAIEYLNRPVVKEVKPKSIKSRATAYLSAITSPANREKIIPQSVKKCVKMPNRNVLYNKSMMKKSGNEPNFRKFTCDKVVKTENDAIPDEQTFYLTGKT